MAIFTSMPDLRAAYWLDYQCKPLTVACLPGSPSFLAMEPCNV